MSATSSFLTRIGRDGAIRSLPLWVVVTALNTSFLLGLIVFRGIQYELAATPTPLLIVVLWLAVAVYLLVGSVRTRCHRLDLALPISSRRLWLSHTLAVTLAGAVVLAASLGVLAAHRRLLSNLGRESILEIPFLNLLGPLTAGLLLAVALTQSYRPALWRLTASRRFWALLVTSLAAVLTLLLVLSRWPAASTVACLALALAVGLRTYRSLPAAYALVPGAAEPGRAPAEETPAISLAMPVGRARVLRLLFAVLHNAPPWKQFMPWLLYAIVMLTGFVIAGGLSTRLAEDIRFFYVPLGTYMLFTGIGLLTYHLFRLDPLPISRALIFGVLALPTLFMFCFGYLGGRLSLASAESPKLVEYRIQEPYYWVEVDPGFMGVAWDGRAPLLTSPWGESHPAWKRSLFRGGSAILYHPFNTAEESSAGFEALMTSRAIEAIYGEVIPFTEILDRYFVVENDRVIGLKGGELTLLQDYPHLDRPSSGPETPILLALIVVPWLLLVALFVRTFRAGTSHKLIRGVYWAALGALLAVMLGQIALAVLGWYSPEAARGFVEVFVRRLGSSPAGTLATWFVSLASMAVCYRLAAAQFLRSEIPGSPIRCTLVNWGSADGEI